MRRGGGEGEGREQEERKGGESSQFRVSAAACDRLEETVVALRGWVSSAPFFHRGVGGSVHVCLEYPGSSSLGHHTFGLLTRWKREMSCEEALGAADVAGCMA